MKSAFLYRHNLSRNLHRFMAVKNYNQSDLSRKTGVTQPTISRMLSMKGAPSVITVAILADALCTIDKVVGVDDLLAFPQ